MNLNNLKPAEGSIRSRKRIGRGQGSGRGGTSTRGHKGAKSRSGYSQKLGFEGGQMPLYRRVPKFGFKNINRKEYRCINFDLIQKLVDDKGLTEITLDILIENNSVKKNDLVKVLNVGQLNSAVSIEAHAFSKTALEMIESKGGKATKI